MSNPDLDPKLIGLRFSYERNRMNSEERARILDEAFDAAVERNTRKVANGGG